MTLPTQLTTREYEKFEEVAGDVAVRVKPLGNFNVQLSGLNIGGRITSVSLNNTTWTALPSTPLSNRNAMSIQNTSAEEIKINYDNSVVGYVGVKISPDSERFYDVTENVIIYAKSSASSITIQVEELA